MKVLLTGPFGNIGQFTLRALLKAGHQVRCFDLPTPANRGAARKLEDKVELFWGDLRNREAVRRAVSGVEAVIHLGFVIPHLSTTGLKSETAPQVAESINIGGTCNLLNVLYDCPAHGKMAPRILFASSLHVYGPTQHLPPPRRITDPVNPVEYYAKHKVYCETMVRESGLPWSIFRLPATLPVRLILDEGMFEVPLENRIEYAHGADVALALARGIMHPGVLGKTLLIGGGTSCQYTYRQLVERILNTIGVGMLPEEAFARTPYATDWLDTRESQELLQYQSRTIENYLVDLRQKLHWRRFFIRFLRPLVRLLMLSRSPYYRVLAA